MIITQGWLNDQPGRFLAIFVFVPILIYKGYHYNDNFIILFALLLFIWDLFWILCGVNLPQK